MISLDGVNKSIQDNTILKDISFNIERGEFVSIIGPNGAGKTTLLKIIDGLLKPDNGTVRVFGKNPLTDGTRIRRNLGFIFQNESVSRKVPLTVMDIVSIGRMGMKGLFKRLGETDYRAIDNAMKEVGLSHLKYRQVGTLSGGEKRKVCIARELARDVDGILMDEILMNLDPSSQMEVNELISKIYSRHNVTIIFVTHLLHYLPGGIKRIIAMKGGEIFWDGNIDEFNRELLAELYGIGNRELERYVGTLNI